MKSYFSFLFLSLIFALFVSFSITSCQKNPCKNSDCGVHAVCNGLNGECVCLDGYTKDASGKCTLLPSPCGGDCGFGTCDSVNASCLCNDGYEKDASGKCTIEGRAKYLGTYTVTEQGQNPALNPYTVTISKGAGIKELVLTGHGGYTCGATNEPIVLSGRLYQNFSGGEYYLMFDELMRYCGSDSYIYNNFAGIQIANNKFSANYSVEITTGSVQLSRAVTATFTKQ